MATTAMTAADGDGDGSKHDAAVRPSATAAPSSAAAATKTTAVHDGDGVDVAHDDAWSALANRNVTRVLLFCLLDGAAYSIWQQQVFQVLIHQLAGDTAVGWMSAASGVAQMASAVVAGVWGDALPRYVVLRAGALAGAAAVLLSLAGVYSLHMTLLYVAQTLWGAYAGIVATSTEAVYADSVATGRRAFVYNVKWMVQTLSSCVGLIATIALLVHLGNAWTRASMVATMYVGLCVHPLAMLTLCSVHDRYSLHEEHALTYVAVRDDDDGRDGHHHYHDDGDATAMTTMMTLTATGATALVAVADADGCTRKATPCDGVPMACRTAAAPSALPQPSSTLHLLAPHDAHDDEDDDHDRHGHTRARTSTAAAAVPVGETVRRGSDGEATRTRADVVAAPAVARTTATAAAAATVNVPSDEAAYEAEDVRVVVDEDTDEVLQLPPSARAASNVCTMTRITTTSAAAHAATRLSCEARAKAVAQQLERRDAAAWRDYATRQAAIAAAAAHGDDGVCSCCCAWLQWLRNAVCFYSTLPFTWSAVPYLVCLVDFLVAFGSGMTLRYLNLYFVNDYGTAPSVLMTATLLTCPTQAAFACLVQYAGDYHVGRIPATIVIRVIGASLLLLMGVTRLPLAVLLPIYVVRNAMTNSVRGVTRSVIMDAVRRENRAKWSAFESFSSFTWSGSAILGGYMAEAHSYQYTFKITALVHYVALAILAPAIVGARRVEQALMRAKQEKAAARKAQHARTHA